MIYSNIKCRFSTEVKSGYHSCHDLTPRDLSVCDERGGLSGIIIFQMG